MRSPPSSLRPGVSVIVPTNNRAARLAALLASLRRQTLPDQDFEVVVVDNGSRDGTREVIREEAERGELHLTPLHRELDSGGPSAPRNVGWRKARGELIAFIDDDCVAVPGWLEALVSAAKENSGAIVQGRTMPNPAELDQLGPFSRTQTVDQLGPYFQTCNILYPRALLERLEGFDEGSHGHSGSGEDTDLAYRALRTGVGAVYAPEALALHAINQIGPIGKLRIAAQWGDSMRVYGRFPELRRRVFTRRIFWKYSHYLLARALGGLLLAFVLPRGLRILALLPSRPYVAHLIDRTSAVGGSALLLPYELLHDVVEMVTVTRGAVRHRTIAL